MPGEYLLDCLFKLGPSRMDGEHEKPVLWQELLAYAQACQLKFERWEFETVMAASRAYVSAKFDGQNPLCIPPVERMNNGHS